MASKHICICICSYKRPHLLKCTLESLRELETAGLFDYSIVVADNDGGESAKATVAEFARTAPIAVTYCVEPEQNISLARNKALEFAKGDFIAWIDDDEFAEKDWLLLFFKTLQESKADGVLGPVKPVFETRPPGWITRGRFFDKPRRVTGLKLRWDQTSTANVLVQRQILHGLAEPFRRQFGSGCEDIDFFKRMMEAGRTFVWCDEAIVSEIVPPARWKRSYLYRRAFLRGRNGKYFADFRSVVKSVIALPLYLLLLPFLFLAGQHLFVRYLMKVGDHAGNLVGLLGLKLGGDKYLAG
ncbi:MAG: glycosyltransferase family 2 protein [Opitutaceae bacterium]|nr:glycosyltransferase family 2 protein [Verrucomicrobiales bacterium]